MSVPRPLVILGLCLCLLAVPAASSLAAGQAPHTPDTTSSLYFVGTSEVHLRVVLPMYDPQDPTRYHVAVLRSGKAIGRVGGPQQVVILKDTGLAHNQVYAYTFKYYDRESGGDGYYATETLPAQTGRVSGWYENGRLLLDGEWSGSLRLVNSTAIIPNKSVVQGNTQIELWQNSTLRIHWAELSDVHIASIRYDDEPDYRNRVVIDHSVLTRTVLYFPHDNFNARLSIRDSRLLGTRVSALAGVLEAFENNSGLCYSSPSGLPDLHFRIEHRLLTDYLLKNNDLPGCRVRFDYKNRMHSIELDGNRLAQVDIQPVDGSVERPLKGMLKLQRNHIDGHVLLDGFAGPALLADNTLQMLKLTEVRGEPYVPPIIVGAAPPADSEATFIVRGNSFFPAPQDWPYFLNSGIAAANLHNARLEKNQIDCNYGQETNGIVLSGGASEVQVLHNNLRNCEGENLYLDGRSGAMQRNLLEGNHITFAESGWHDLYHPMIRLEHITGTNQVVGNLLDCDDPPSGGWGDGLHLDGVARTQVRGNLVRWCYNGILLTNVNSKLPTTANLLRDNLLLRNYYSLNLAGQTFANQVLNNRMLSSGANGYHTNVNLFSLSRDCQGSGQVCRNAWNQVKQPGSNIVGGPFLGGSYYDTYDGTDANGDGLGDQPYQLFKQDWYSDSVNIDDLPLIGHPGPDLSLAPLQLLASQVTRTQGTYRLPVAVRLFNNGDQDAGAFAVRVQDLAGWSLTLPVSGLASAAVHTLQVDWDLTPALLAGNGAGSLGLKVTVDISNTVDEILENDNAAGGELELDLRPRLEAVTPEYRLGSSYYLEQESVPNRIRVQVDWNGELPGAGQPPYGELIFNLNAVETRLPGQAGGVTYSLDMGRDLQAGLQCANNLLRLRAILPVAGGHFSSLEQAWQPTLFSLPGWVEWVITHIPGSDPAFETTLQAPLVQYAYDFKYPEPPFAATWTPPGWIPYVGGQALGIQATQGSLSTSSTSSGEGQARAEGRTGLALAALTAEGRVYGQGELAFNCGQSLDLKRAELGFEIRAPIAVEMGLADLVPALRAAEKWPVVGRMLQWINQVASVKSSTTPAIQVTTEFSQQQGALAFAAGQGSGSLEKRVALAVAPVKDLSAEVFGGGRPYLTLQVPENPTYLKEIGLQLFYAAGFQAWAFEAAYERRIDCQYPGECRQAAAERLAGSPLHLLPRRYLGAEYARFQAGGVQQPVDLETVLLSHIYPRPQPALALAPGSRLLTYVHDDPALPPGRGTEIQALAYLDGAWQVPLALTADEQPDFAPAVAFDGLAQFPVVWEHADLARQVTVTLDITFARSLEIHTCVWTPGGACRALPALTADRRMDYAPQVVGAGNGAALALWQSCDGVDLLGSPGHPLDLNYSLWQSASGWSAPGVALSGLTDVLQVAVAARAAEQASAAVVYVRDLDGDLASSQDSELFYSQYDGLAWSAPQRLTNDSLADAAPALAYDAGGTLHLVWQRGGQLTWLAGTWQMAQARPLAPASEAGVLGLRLAQSGSGDLALAWQALTAAGQGSLRYSLYDPAAGTWSSPQALISLANGLPSDPALAYAENGDLLLAYRRIHLLSQADGQTSAGSSDLVALVHRPAWQLQVQALQVDGLPAPGAALTLTARVGNRGDRAAPAAQVFFYDNNVLLGAALPVPPLPAGVTTSVQTTLTLGQARQAHNLSAAVFLTPLLPSGAPFGAALDRASSGVLLPDLAVEAAYAAVGAQQSLELTARLVNAGQSDYIAPLTATLRAGNALTGSLLAALPLELGLSPGQALTLTQVFTELGALAGVEKIWLTVGPAAAVSETRLANNQALFYPRLWPDLAGAAGGQDPHGGVVFTLFNQGLAPSGPVPFQVRAGGLDGRLVYTDTLPALQPGESFTLTLPAPAGLPLLFLQIDPGHSLPERDESNNLTLWQVHAARQPYRVALPVVKRR